jgi:enoyl-[acyl-carrier-protein] reductase (NADH)
MIPTVKAKLLEGKRGLIVGIANDQSIAWTTRHGARLDLTPTERQACQQADTVHPASRINALLRP